MTGDLKAGQFHKGFNTFLKICSIFHVMRTIRMVLKMYLCKTVAAELFNSQHF